MMRKSKKQRAKMTKTLLATAALALLATPALAGGELNYGKAAGTYCLTSSDDMWSWFEPGKCPTNGEGEWTQLTLKKKGDYTIVGENKLHCKADPKSYFKGWTNYICEKMADDGKELTKHVSQKFLFDPTTRELGFNRGDVEDQTVGPNEMGWVCNLSGKPHQTKGAGVKDRRVVVCSL
jgi:hypothetical protein